MRSKRARLDLRIDEGLCYEIERLMDGTAVHQFASLAGAYRSAVADYRRTGDPFMGELANEAERALRKLLATLRDGYGRSPNAGLPPA